MLSGAGIADIDSDGRRDTIRMPLCQGIAKNATPIMQ